MSSSTNFNSKRNGFHLFIELLEKNESPTKKQLESNKNHVGDIICFLLGWLLSYHLNLNIPGILYPILWILLIYVTMHEIIREIFPYIENRLVKGAYIYQNVQYNEMIGNNEKENEKEYEFQTYVRK